MSFHQEQVKKAQEEARNKFDVRGGNVYTNIASFERHIETILTEYGQALREDMREYAELMGYEYVDGHMDDLGIPPKTGA